MLSIPHMLVVFVIVLVVFGPQKLPELARSLGKLMAEFRKASSDFRGAFEEEMKDLERQAREVERKKAAETADKAADEAPIEPATFATPAGTETPISGADISPVSGDGAGGTGDTRATEAATGELVVTPVAGSVPRSSTELTETTNQTANATANETATETVNETAGAAIRIDVPHDRQPA